MEGQNSPPVQMWQSNDNPRTLLLTCLFFFFFFSFFDVIYSHDLFTSHVTYLIQLMSYEIKIHQFGR